MIPPHDLAGANLDARSAPLALAGDAVHDQPVAAIGLRVERELGLAGRDRPHPPRAVVRRRSGRPGGCRGPGNLASDSSRAAWSITDSIPDGFWSETGQVARSFGGARPSVGVDRDERPQVGSPPTSG